MDAEGARLPERTIGSVWLRSESIGDGYWKDPPSGSTTFGNLVPGDPEPWLSTGDLGFLHDGELYITGRQADRIVVQGRTLFAEDVEEAGARDVRLGGVGVVGVLRARVGGDVRDIGIGAVDASVLRLGVIAAARREAEREGRGDGR